MFYTKNDIGLPLNENYGAQKDFEIITSNEEEEGKWTINGFCPSEGVHDEMNAGNKEYEKVDGNNEDLAQIIERTNSDKDLLERSGEVLQELQEGYDIEIEHSEAVYNKENDVKEGNEKKSDSKT